MDGAEIMALAGPAILYCTAECGEDGDPDWLTTGAWLIPEVGAIGHFDEGDDGAYAEGVLGAVGLRFRWNYGIIGGGVSVLMLFGVMGTGTESSSDQDIFALGCRVGLELALIDGILGGELYYRGEINMDGRGVNTIGVSGYIDLFQLGRGLWSYIDSRWSGA